MTRNVFTLNIAFTAESNRHSQNLPQFILCKEEFARDCLVTLMEQFVAFNKLFTWLRTSREEAESTSTKPVVYTTGLSAYPDVIVIIGNEGTAGPVAMKHEYPKSIVLWSTYTNADQRDARLRILTANGVVTCHDLDTLALKERVHALLAERHGVIFPSLTL